VEYSVYKPAFNFNLKVGLLLFRLKIHRENPISLQNAGRKEYYLAYGQRKMDAGYEINYSSIRSTSRLLAWNNILPHSLKRIVAPG